MSILDHLLVRLRMHSWYRRTDWRTNGVPRSAQSTSARNKVTDLATFFVLRLAIVAFLEVRNLGIRVFLGRHAKPPWALHGGSPHAFRTQLLSQHALFDSMILSTNSYHVRYKISNV